MKIYILTDMEGVSGIVSFDECAPSSPNFTRSKRLATLEVNAAIEGILSTGDHEIVVFDGHGPGGIEFELLHKSACLVMGRPVDMLFYMDKEQYDACMIIGQHAMRNTPFANLHHTFNSKTVISLTINNHLIGEAGVAALRAGIYDIPTIFLSGDRAACDEIETIIPNIHTCEVKKGLNTTSAVCLAPEMAREKIKSSAAFAMNHMSDIKPYKLEPPYIAEWVFFDSKELIPYMNKNYCKIIQPNKVQIYAEDMEDLIKNKLWGF